MVIMKDFLVGMWKKAFAILFQLVRLTKGPCICGVFPQSYPDGLERLDL
jgi:hypothetical protein